MRVALAQIDTTVGDFDGNVEKIRAAACGVKASLVVFPELSICGYMPRDLLDELSFVERCRAALDELAADTSLPPLLVGAPLGSTDCGEGGQAEGDRDTGEYGKGLYNAAVLISGGGVRRVFKGLLPNYDVFDERRYFRDAGAAELIEIDGVRIGVTICEDAWSAAGGGYARDPVAELAGLGAEVIVNLSASPFERDKPALRRELIAAHASRHGVALAVCNLVGGNDQVLFDGNSFAVTAAGQLCAHAAAFREDVVVTDFTGTARPPENESDRVAAIVMGLKDYFKKTGFAKAVIGMSGGIDSSLVACLAVRALGPEHVTGVAMPGPFNAPESLDCARELAAGLGIGFHVLPIHESYRLLQRSLRDLWGEQPFDRAEENLQARLRGTLLMALSNKEGSLVLVPSNKSELAMGYCTLYGDMVGALAPIADLYKGEVYELARRFEDVIPEHVFARPPSAELRPGQTDQDTLPPYDVLDEILRLHLEARCPPAGIVDRTGRDRALIDRILRSVAANEYKRQQGAPVLKLSSKAFGYGRRFPIAERFHGGAE